MLAYLIFALGREQLPETQFVLGGGEKKGGFTHVVHMCWGQTVKCVRICVCCHSYESVYGISTPLAEGWNRSFQS